MVEFCPECGSLLRKRACRCGYNQPKPKETNNGGLNYIWNPPSPNIIYCKITATPIEKLRSALNKGDYPDKLKEIKINLRNHQYTCCNCVYYNEEINHCQIYNKFYKKDSICKRFEPFEI